MVWKFFLIAAVGICFSCHRKTSTTLTNSSDQRIQEEKPVSEFSSTPQLSNEGYVNDLGWKIPESKSKTIRETKIISARTVSGDPIQVNSVTYGLSQPILLQDPVKAVDRSREESVRIWAFTELRTNGRFFCYELEAQPFSPRSGKALAVKYIYRICDLNGDSIFETLSFGKAGLAVPDWVTK